jgi:hypothetical protein
MKRKAFLQDVAWLAGGALLTRYLPVKALYTAPVTIRGRVLSGHKGVKGVVVSDGYTVMATDANGRYQFPAHPEAVAVCISTPAGYVFNNENGIARHYRLISEINIKKSVDFNLVPLPVNDDEHQFIIWADTQVKNKSDVKKLMTQSVPDVKKLVADAGLGVLFHGITVGDIVWDDLEYFADYDSAIKETGIPFFQCLGNHDMDYRKGGDETSDDTFHKTYGPTWYSFNRGKAHYVIMDDVRYLGIDRNYDGYITQAQLEWLQKDLSFVPADHLLIICVHIPVHNGVKNNGDLYSLLQNRKVHIMSGHTHYNVNKEAGHIYEHNHGTVCGAWWTGNICSDGTPSGYGVYKVKGTELSWHYKATGKPADFQFTTYLQPMDNGCKILTANIWNYDASWQTEVIIDGKNAGPMQQIEGYDPEAYKSMLGPDLPRTRGFAEPQLTNHLFSITLPNDARQWTLVVTDRFGNKYTDTQYV